MKSAYISYLSEAHLKMVRAIDSIENYYNYLKSQGIIVNKAWFTNEISKVHLTIRDSAGINTEKITGFFTPVFNVSHRTNNCSKSNFVLPAFPVVAVNFSGDTVTLVGFFPSGFQNLQLPKLVLVDVNYQWRNPSEAAFSSNGNFAYITDTGNNELVP